MKDVSNTTPEITELRAAEAREIAGGTEPMDRAPIYDENGNVIGGCIPQPGTRVPFQF